MAARERRILGAIRDGYITSNQIAWLLKEKPQSMSAYLNMMARKKMIVRGPHAPGRACIQWRLPNTEAAA